MASVGIIGLGRMGIEHCASLVELGKKPKFCMGRSDGGAIVFSNKFGFPLSKSEELSAINFGRADGVVICTTHDQQILMAKKVIDIGCKNILLEKPGGLYLSDMDSLQQIAQDNGAQVFIGYNRRFYRSLDLLNQIVNNDGGVLSIHFEFNEIESLVLKEKLTDEVRARWGFVNSLHIIDLAFYIAGKPVELHASRAGKKSWHPSASIFSGFGKTIENASFTYQGNWESPGRWGLDIGTSKHRIILRPIEELRVQVHNQNLEVIELPEKKNLIKEGVLEQMSAFISYIDTGKIDPRLCTLSMAINSMSAAQKIFDYPERSI